MKTWLSMMALALFGCSGEGGGSKISLQVEGQAVECLQGSGAGDAPAPEETTSTCDQAYSECTDGRVYRVVCDSVIGSKAATCDCYVGDEKVKAAVSVSDECPVAEPLARIACQWD